MEIKKKIKIKKIKKKKYNFCKNLFYYWFWQANANNKTTTQIIRNRTIQHFRPIKKSFPMNNMDMHQLCVHEKLGTCSIESHKTKNKN